MASQPAHDFDYSEFLAKEGRLLPFKKLEEAVSAELVELSDRAFKLERSIASSLINGGLLAVGAGLLFYLADATVAAVPAIFALIAWRNVPSFMITRRRTVDDIEAFENRLSEKNFGVKWDGGPRGRRMNVRVFWRDGARIDA